MANLSLEQLLATMSEYVDLSGVQVRESSVLGEDIPVDSAQMLRVVTRLEARYGVKFSPQGLLEVRTIGQLMEQAQAGEEHE